MHREGPGAAESSAQCTYGAVKYVGSEVVGGVKSGAGIEVGVYVWVYVRAFYNKSSLFVPCGRAELDGLIELLSLDNGYLLGPGHRNKARHRTAVLLGMSVAFCALRRYVFTCVSQP